MPGAHRQGRRRRKGLDKNPFEVSQTYVYLRAGCLERFLKAPTF